MAKQYYWLKLRENWFRDLRIKKLRTIAGGDTLTIIYLKMQLLSLKDEGKLFFEGVEKDFASEIALQIEEEVENVSLLLGYLQAKGLIEYGEQENEFVLTEVTSSVGTESSEAVRQREYRGKKKRISALNSSDTATLGQCCDNDVTLSRHCHTEIELEIEKELEKDIEIDTIAPSSTISEPAEPPFITMILNTGEEYPFYQKDIEEFRLLYPAVDIEQQFRTMKAWCINNRKNRKTAKGIRRFVNSWLAREQDKYHPPVPQQSSGRDWSKV